MGLISAAIAAATPAFASQRAFISRSCSVTVSPLRFASMMVLVGAFLLCVQPAHAQLPSSTGWTALPASTALSGSGACPANNFGGDPYQFTANCLNVIRAWNGAVADTTANRLIIWGGGHNNYYGNEIYSLNLTANPITLRRLKEPTVPTNFSNSANCIDGIPPSNVDFSPNSRESYAGMAFIPSVDRMYITGGALACTNGYGSRNTWTISLNNLSNSNAWVHEDITLAGPIPGANGGGTYGMIADYDRNSGLVFLSDAGAIYTYNYQSNTYTRITSTQGFITSIYLSGAVDPSRKLFVVAGGCGGGSCGPGNGVFVADISDTTTTTQQNWTAATMADATCAEFLSGGVNAISSANPGFTYDSVANDFVGWPNQGNSVYILTPDTVNKRLTCQKQTFASGPPNSSHASGAANTSNGTFGRFRYFPGLDVFVLVNDWNIPAYVLRLRSSTSPGFTLTPTPSSRSVAAGSSATYAVSVGAVNGFSGTVNLSLSGLPAGATGTFNPASVAAGASSTLTVVTTSSTPTGSYTLSITGTSGGIAASTSVGLTVTGGSTGSNISFVQGAFNAPQGNANSVSATYPALQTNGNLNVVVIGWNDTTNTVTSVADTFGNSYTLAAGPTKLSGFASQAIYYAKSIGVSSGNTNTVKVTFSGAALYPDLRILEYANADPTNPLDAGAGNTGTSTNTSVTLTTTNANDLILGANYVSHSTTGPASGFTSRMITPDADIVEDQIVASAGTRTVSAPQSPSGWWVMNAAGFRAASGPTDTQPPTTPANLSASAVSGTQINLSWTASTDNVGVTGYKVEQCQGSACSNFAQVGTTGGSTKTYSATGLTAATSYSYRVRATDAAGNLSTYSNIASATTQTGPPPSVAFVQGAYNAPQGNTPSVAATFTGVQAAGDLNIVVIGWNDTTATVKTITDSKGNAYTLAVGPTQLSGVVSQSIYYAKSIVAATANANTVTVAFNGSAAYPDLRILEYSGAPATNPIDAVGGASGTSTTASATLTAATTNANDLILAGDYIQTTTPGPGAGFTARMISQPNSDLVEDKTVTSTGTYTGTAPQTGSGYWVMQVVAIK